MPANYFTTFTEQNGIKLSGRSRKVWHSLTNSMTSSSNGTKTEQFLSVGAGVVAGTANTMVVASIAGSAATLGGLVSTTAMGGALGALGFTTGTLSISVAVVCGPATAILLGVGSLAYLAYNKYSDREGAHERLRPYVYNLIDDVKPAHNLWEDSNTPVQKQHLANATSAALYLLKEGDSQYQLMGKKLQDAQATFNTFWNGELNHALTQLANFDNEKLPDLKIHVNYSGEDMRDPVKRGNYNKGIDLAIALDKARKYKASVWPAAIVQDGAVFEFMRRLIHLGNYLQASAIVHYATFKTLNNRNPQGFISPSIAATQPNLNPPLIAPGLAQPAIVLQANAPITDPGDLLLLWESTGILRAKFTEMGALLQEVIAQEPRIAEFLRAPKVVEYLAIRERI
jgi:hypothetical protein